MKKTKNTKYIFTLTMTFLLSLLLNTNVYAALDMTEWEIDIEKNIINDYKTKADEANVSFMKDKDSVVGDIVEYIYEEGSTKSGFDINPVNDSDFDGYKEALYESWGELLYEYSQATGYVNGTVDMLNSSTPQTGIGFNFYLDDTEIQEIFADYENWTSDQQDYYATILDKMARDLRGKFQNCKFSYEYYYSYDSTNTNITVTCNIYDANGNFYTSVTETMPKNDWNGTSEYSKAIRRAFTNSVATTINNSKKELILKNNIEMDSNCAFNSFIFLDETHVDLYFDDITSASFSSWNTRYESKFPLYSNAGNKTTSVKSMCNGENTTGSWVYAILYDIAFMDPNVEMHLHMATAGSSDPYVKARMDCLTYIIKVYNTAYAQSFISMINNASTNMESHLYYKSYLTYGEYESKAPGFGASPFRVIYYEGASFRMDDYRNNDYIRILGASGFYFKNRCLKLNNYGIPDNSLTSDMKLDENNQTHIDGIFRLFLSINNPDGIQDNVSHYKSLVRTAAVFDNENLWVQPRPFDIVFDDRQVSYTEFLTTSCIINNPLDRYEFWGQNVSNEKDTTYYGEAIELLPDNENDESTKNKDGYIGNPSHIVELNPNDNWGIFLFTRYKYVNYIYKIYYGFYGANPQMIAKNITRTTNYRNAYEDDELSTIVFPKYEDNMYGWFWKKTYSNREYTNGNEPYVTEDIVNQQETLIRERIMQNVESNNNIKWLSPWEINNQNFNSMNNLRYNRGDLYCYENPVRAETIYYQVNVPFSVDENAERNAANYILSLGADKNGTFQCEEAVTLCECDDEISGCSLDTDDLSILSSITN